MVTSSPNNTEGGSHADFYDVPKLDRPGNPRCQDSPKRSQAARDLAKKVGVEIKHLYLTSGDSDLVIFVHAPSGDNVAKFALAVSSLGNVRTRTVRAWSADEYRSSFLSCLGNKRRDTRGLSPVGPLSGLPNHKTLST